MEINSYLHLPPINVANLATGGAIGTAAATVDVCAAYRVAQTTVGQTLTLPNPTVVDNGRTTVVYNSGTASFLMHGNTVAPLNEALFTWQDNAWRIAGGAPAPTPSDFWRSGVGATTLPDGLADLTENIRRNGAVGVNADPTSFLHIGGSIASVPTIIAAAGTTPLDVIHHYVEVTSAALTHTLTLPAANAAIGREYIVHLAAGNTVSVVTVTAPANTLELVGGGIGTSVVLSHPALRTAVWKSDGSVWQLLDADRGSSTAAVSPTPWAAGSINIGDAIPAGARTINPGSTNIASATGLDGPAVDARMQVVFTAPVPSANYIVNGELSSVAAGNWNADNDTAFIIVSKSTTGFVMATREISSAVQNLNFDFVVTPIQPPATAVSQTSAKYVGSAAGVGASVVLGNFIIRNNATTTNIEIATVTGTESIAIYSMVLWANAQFDTATPMTLTTAFQILGDPGTIPGQEMRRVTFGPAAVGDPRMFELTILYLNAAKIAMKLEQW